MDHLVRGGSNPLGRTQKAPLYAGFSALGASRVRPSELACDNSVTTLGEATTGDGEAVCPAAAHALDGVYHPSRLTVLSSLLRPHR